MGLCYKTKITDTFILCILRVWHTDDGMIYFLLALLAISLKENSHRRAVRAPLAAETKNLHDSVTSHIRRYFLFL